MNIHVNNHGNQNVNVNSNTSSVNISPQSTEKLNVSIHSVEPIKLSLREANTSRVNISTPVSIVTGDYNALTGLPSINGVTVKGALTYIDLFLAKSSVNTKQYWNSHGTYIPERGEIVIYQDRITVDNVDYPGIKIGDGTTYLIDLPFLGDDTTEQLLSVIYAHISDTSIHVTPEEKTFWNNKLNCVVDNGNLIFDRQ